MSLLSNQKAEEIIELCLSKESSEHKRRVVEILALSGIEPNDPLFLALLSTGSLRVFFEQALTELKKAIVEIDNSTQEVEAVREQTRNSLIEANSRLLEQLFVEREEFLSTLIDSNKKATVEIQESLKELKVIRSEIIELNTLISRERAEHIRVMKSLIDGLAKTTSELERASSRIKTVQHKKQFFSLKNLRNLFFCGLIFLSLSLTSYSLFFREKEVEEASLIVSFNFQ